MTDPNTYRRIAADPNSRLAQLAEMYAEAKPTADAAAERLKTITDAIKAEMQAAAPGATEVDLDGPVPLHMSWKRPWKLDSTRMKKEAPELYVQWAKQGRGYWELRGGRS